MNHRTVVRLGHVGVLVGAIGLAACSGQPSRPDLARQCEQGLAQANKELDFAKADGFSGTVEWAKAASLLSAAAIQKQFEKYPNCIEKVDRARYYIRASKQ